MLSFPAIAEADEEHRFETICFRRRQGDALHPDREPLDILARIHGTIGEYHFAGQYQQSSAPLGGGLVKGEWFKQSWDTANKATELSRLLCLHHTMRSKRAGRSFSRLPWGVKGKDLYLLAVFRRHLEYPAPPSQVGLAVRIRLPPAGSPMRNSLEAALASSRRSPGEVVFDLFQDLEGFSLDDYRFPASI